MMSTSSGRRRALNTSTGEDAALDSIARRAEEMLQEKRKERERARRIRLQELEKKQREDEEALDRQYAIDKTAASSRTYAANTSSVSSKDDTRSRKSSMDSTDSIDGLSAGKDYKSLYNELDEKYRRSMMTNAQLDNEKQALMYTVDDLKDKLDDMEEAKYSIQRELKDKQKQLDAEKRCIKTKEAELDRLKEMMRQRDELLKEHKLIYVEAEEPVQPPLNTQENGLSNGEHTNFYIDPISNPTRAALISQDIMEILDAYTPGSIEDKVRCVLNENTKLKRELNTVRDDLDSEREQASKRPQKRPSDGQINGVDLSNNPQVVELQRESTRQISEYKLKVQKAELDIAALESSVSRLEGQVKRYKEMAEDSEKAEDDLKAEKRKMQRELRESQQQIEELETQKSHLQNRLDRIRQARREVLGNTDPGA